MGGQGFQVGANLVADIAIDASAVAADDTDIDPALLHQVPTGVVDDQGVGYALLG